MTKTRQQQCDHRPGSSSAIKKTRRQTVRSKDQATNCAITTRQQIERGVATQLRSERPDNTECTCGCAIKGPGAGWELGCDHKDQTTPSVGEKEMDGREDRQQGDDVGR